MDNKEIILATDERAAKIGTVTGWISRNGIFYGDHEEAARYNGCTHIICTYCKIPTPKPFNICIECKEERAIKRYGELEKKPWNGEDPIYSEYHDCYFYDFDEISDVCCDKNITPRDLRLVHCEPVYPRRIDEDFFHDDLPDDYCGLPDVLVRAIEAFNSEVKKCPPLSWWPTNIAVDLGSSEGLNDA